MLYVVARIDWNIKKYNIVHFLVSWKIQKNVFCFSIYKKLLIHNSQTLLQQPFHHLSTTRFSYLSTETQSTFHLSTMLSTTNHNPKSYPQTYPQSTSTYPQANFNNLKYIWPTNHITKNIYNLKYIWPYNHITKIIYHFFIIWPTNHITSKSYNQYHIWLYNHIINKWYNLNHIWPINHMTNQSYKQ